MHTRSLIIGKPVIGIMTHSGFAVLAGLGLVVLFAAGCNMQQNDGFERHEVTVNLGEREVTIVRYTSGEVGLSMINLHEDEQTSIKAAKKYIKEYGGSLTYMRHDRERRFAFAKQNEHYSIDPNRIYTDHGIQNTLQDGGSYHISAHHQVRNLAENILDLYDFEDRDVVVAVHNNHINGFSILSYTEGGDYEHNASRVHVEEGQDINDFFYVTDERFYEYLMNRGFNVLLQDQRNVENDGSLSVYSGYRNVPYINIEAGRGHYEEQTRMIRVVEEMLAELGFE